MLTRLLAVAVLAAAPLAPLAAQSATAFATVREMWQGSARNVLESANDMPADKFGFRPTPGVRTFGELVAHVAGTQDMLCAMALGEPVPSEDAVEKLKSDKATIVAAMQKSTAHCDRAYALAGDALAKSLDVFGQKKDVNYALVMNAMHNSEHYGNLVTYLRMNGLVPPTSKPRRSGM